MNQIAVRGVNFQDSKACVRAPAAPPLRRLYDASNAFLRIACGNGYLSEYGWRWARQGPRHLLRRKLLSRPRFLRTPFSACVGELHARHGPWLLRKCVIRARNSMCASLADS